MSKVFKTTEKARAYSRARYARLKKSPSFLKKAAARQRAWMKKHPGYSKEQWQKHKEQRQKDYAKWRRENYALYRKTKENYRKKNLHRWRKYSAKSRRTR